jgi:hypothetical protein
MSKKRKRHQNNDNSVESEDDVFKLSENAHPDGDDSVFTKLLSPDEIDSVRKKIFHATKEMSRALKKARDFEVRKIIKRIKTAEWVSYLL